MVSGEVKEEVVGWVQGLLARYPTIAIASLEKVKAAQLQELRKRFGEGLEIHVVKNTSMRKALESFGQGREKLSPYLTGQNIFIFASESPFNLAFLLEKSRVKAQAKAGDVAPKDIVVPAGNTGLAPGPVISDLNAAGLPTKIEAGSVWVASDTVVAKRGELIAPGVASVLAKLGIKPIEVGLTLRVAYSDNLILTAEQLALDITAVEGQFKRAYSDALTLAFRAEYFIPEVLPALLLKAYGEARVLGVGSGYTSPDFIGEVLARAETQAALIASIVYGKALQAPSA